jgi:CRISPR-associated exonuclease Cas4
MRHINGTLIASYFVCKRELWLMAYELVPDQDNTFLEVGRFVEESSYDRERKGYLIGDIKIDLLKKDNETLVIGEIKKSSRSEKSGIMQLSYYLMVLEELGIKAKGEVFIPKERKRIPVELNDERRKEINEAINNIEAIIQNPIPPPPKRIKYCTNCAYREFCWS